MNCIQCPKAKSS